jgi:hypothetical protein
MWRVLDSFRVVDELGRRYAGAAEPLPEGVWFILDPEQTAELTLPAPGTVATITRPDGSAVVAEIAEARRPHSAVGLRFQGLGAGDIPRLSVVEW